MSKDNTATVTNGDTSVKVELHDDGVIAFEVIRNVCAVVSELKVNISQSAAPSPPTATTFAEILARKPRPKV